MKSHYMGRLILCLLLSNGKEDGEEGMCQGTVLPANPHAVARERMRPSDMLNEVSAITGSLWT